MFHGNGLCILIVLLKNSRSKETQNWLHAILRCISYSILVFAVFIRCVLHLSWDQHLLFLRPSCLSCSPLCKNTQSSYLISDKFFVAVQTFCQYYLRKAYYCIFDTNIFRIVQCNDENTIISCTPDDKIQVHPRFWSGSEILVWSWCSDPGVLTLCLILVVMDVT